MSNYEKIMRDSTLSNEVKWLKNIIYIGFSILLSAIVYFNNATQDNMIIVKDHVISLHKDMSKVSNVLAETASRHDGRASIVEFRLDSLEKFCCIDEKEVSFE